MLSAIRYDRGILNPPTETQTGIRVDGAFTRAGVFEYHRADGTISRELRLLEDVASPAALDSYRLMPVTVEHPSALLTPDTAKGAAVGAVGENLRVDGEWVKGGIALFDSAGIAAAKNKRFVSMGYRCDIDETPGVHPIYGAYDRIQRNHRGNHLALTGLPRAGSGATLRFDSAGVMVEKESQAMPDNKPDDDLITRLAKQTARADAAEESNKALAKELADTKAKLTSAEKDRTDAMGPVGRDLMRKRLALETEAGGILGDTVKLDSMTDADIKKAVLTKLRGKLEIPSGRTDSAYVDAYVDHAYDSAMIERKAGITSLNKVGANLADTAPSRVDAEDPDAARARMTNANLNAWRGDTAGNTAK